LRRVLQAVGLLNKEHVAVVVRRLHDLGTRSPVLDICVRVEALVRLRALRSMMVLTTAGHVALVAVETSCAAHETDYLLTSHADLGMRGESLVVFGRLRGTVGSAEAAEARRIHLLLERMTCLRIKQVSCFLTLSEMIALIVTVVHCSVNWAAEITDIRLRRIVARRAVDAVEGRIHVRLHLGCIASRQRIVRTNLAELSELPLVSQVRALNKLLKEVGL